MLYPVALPLISLPEEGSTCLLNLLLTTDCYTQTEAQLMYFCLLFLNLFIQSRLLCSFFTLTHFSFYSFFKHPDINECLSVHACQLNERCVNTAGSYICQRLIICPPGHQINNDVCEGIPLLICIKVFTSTHSEYVVNNRRRGFVLLHAHNVRKAHCTGKQSLLPPLRVRIELELDFF